MKGISLAGIAQIATRRRYQGVRVLPDQLVFESWPRDNNIALAQRCISKDKRG
jgi:hypothetical protein